MTNALEVEGLAVGFGRRQVLRGLSFSVPAGGSLAVIGPNGSGKTVLFRALIGSLPHQGEVRWAPATRIGYVPQKLDVERDLPLTGWDFVAAKAAVVRASQVEARHALELVRLPEEAVASPVGALSGGQFQRLLLAAALVGRPNALLFDEPTSGVDEPGEERLYQVIHRLQVSEGLTLLFISHELNVVFRFAANVLCLGQDPPCYGPPEEILTPRRIAEVYGEPMGYHHH
ncbi:MAG TPA: metal ABC transporter ATP-binding protein [Anaeromyxobacteraceae bacterium]|nr:metal ABC transporter ATP-binding protein [Anaeromyxobacteraceae bacterium]